MQTTLPLQIQISSNAREDILPVVIVQVYPVMFTVKIRTVLTLLQLEKSELKILSLNVCGLLSKLQIPEFSELLQSYDIIGIQESKTDDVDNVSV